MTGQIYEIIPKIRAKVGVVAKTQQTNGPGVNYSFRGHDQVVNALVPFLNEFGVFTTIEDSNHIVTSTVTKTGKVQTRSTLYKKVTFYAPDGSSVSSVVAAESTDFADKATGSASTYAYRMALTQTFTLPTGDADPDSKYEPTEAPDDASKGTPSQAEEKRALQKQVREAAEKRGMDQNDYMALGNSKFGEKWSGDPDKLRELLKAIEAGEVA